MALAVSKLNMSDNFNATHMSGNYNETQGPTELFSYRESEPQQTGIFNDFNPCIVGNVE